MVPFEDCDEDEWFCLSSNLYRSALAQQRSCRDAIKEVISEPGRIDCRQPRVAQIRLDHQPRDVWNREGSDSGTEGMRGAISDIAVTLGRLGVILGAMVDGLCLKAGFLHREMNPRCFPLGQEAL